MWWNRPRRIEIKVKQSSNYSQWRNFRDLVLSNNPARGSSPSPKTGQERSANFKSNSLFKPSHSAPSRSLTSSSTSQPKTSSPSLFSIEPQIVIHWSSITTPGHNDLLKDRNLQLLDSGATSNGDGNLVSLGYFSDANSTHPFNGTWVPLTYGTRSGDSSSG